MSEENKHNPVDAGNGESASNNVDLSPIVDAIKAMGNDIAEIKGRNTDPIRDPEKTFKDAYAKRDEYKRERDDLANRLASLQTEVDASKDSVKQAVALVERRHKVQTSLKGLGVSRPEFALRGLGVEDVELLDIGEGEDGALALDAILERIKAASPELLQTEEEGKPVDKPVRNSPPPAFGGAVKTTEMTAMEKYTQRFKELI